MLTKEQVENIHLWAGKCSPPEPLVQDVCDDNVAMRKMLEAVIDNLEFAVAPGAPLSVEVLERHIRGQLIRLKGLLG